MFGWLPFVEVQKGFHVLSVDIAGILEVLFFLSRNMKYCKCDLFLLHGIIHALNDYVATFICLSIYI